MVYHHCLFGVRYDFLCANYTAFDQTLFNCNFVSNVDCQNSKRFWHRNDELYVTKSTTTTPAPIVYSFYTAPTNLYAGSPRGRTQFRGQAPSPQQPAEMSGQSEQTIAQPVTQQPQQVIYVDPGLEPKRRPRPQRRRPAYDYYDDYEERPRRQRPRRPRPLYYDYDDYEEDRYERRGSTRRRRPHDRRSMMRENERRRKYDYYDDEDYLEEEYDDTALDKKKPSRKRKFDDDDDDVDADTRRDRSRSQPKPKSRLGVRRPPSEDYEDELQKSDKSDTSRERSRKSSKEGTDKGDENQSLGKPAGLYDRPRPSPKINVPRNSYKTMEESEDSTVTTTTTTATTTTTPRPSTSRFSARKRTKQTEGVPEPDNLSTSTTSEAVTVLRKFKRPAGRKQESDEEERPAPVRVKVPIRLTKLKKTTEATPLDTLYDTYDVTLNEASPVADLTPQRGYPAGIGADDYAFGYYGASKVRR